MTQFRAGAAKSAPLSAAVKRFKERYGSYPVLRIHDYASKSTTSNGDSKVETAKDIASRELGGRIDGNKVAGRIPVKQLLEQMTRGLKEFRKRHPQANPKKGSS